MKGRNNYMTYCKSDGTYPVAALLNVDARWWLGWRKEVAQTCGNMPVTASRPVTVFPNMRFSGHWQSWEHLEYSPYLRADFVTVIVPVLCRVLGPNQRERSRLVEAPEEFLIPLSNLVKFRSVKTDWPVSLWRSWCRSVVTRKRSPDSPRMSVEIRPLSHIITELASVVMMIASGIRSTVLAQPFWYYYLCPPELVIQKFSTSCVLLISGEQAQSPNNNIQNFNS